MLTFPWINPALCNVESASKPYIPIFATEERHSFYISGLFIISLKKKMDGQKYEKGQKWVDKYT